MAQIDLTLGGFMVPAIPEYVPPVGTKKGEGGLSTREVNDNIMMPFLNQRPVQVSEDSTVAGGTRVEADRRLALSRAGVVLSLSDSEGAKATAGFAGVEVQVSATFASGASFVSYWTDAARSETVSVTPGTYVTVAGDASGYWHLKERVHNGAVMPSGAGVAAASPRFLTFDFTDPDRRSVKVKGGTHIPLEVASGGTTARWWWDVDEDTVLDLAEGMQAAADAAQERPGEDNGREFYLYLALVGGRPGVVVSLDPSCPSDAGGGYTQSNTRRIGALHTLCVDAGESLAGQVAAAPGTVSAGDLYPVKRYSTDDGDGFYGFYNRRVTAVSANSTYDTLTVEHPLAGFEAGQILPESVWCLTFRPRGCEPAGMVYEPDTDTAVDIYLQSGRGKATASVYGGTTTRNRQPINHQADMLAVGKRLPTDNEFLAFAAGSNEKTAVSGAKESSVVTAGGHTDTAGRRMVSFTGCEDCCGAVWQWLDEIAPDGGSSFATYDGVASFGQAYGTPYVLGAGGGWSNGASCGSRGRSANSPRSRADAYCGARGSSRVARGM